MRRIAAGLLALSATVALAVTAPAAGAHGLTLVQASAEASPQANCSGTSGSDR